MTEAIRTSAQRRTGGAVADWAQVLADAQLDLIARPDGVTAARVTAERVAIAKYRGELARRLNQLALHLLGVSPLLLLVPLTRLLPRNCNDPIILTPDRLAAVATEMLDCEARELAATVAARAL